MMLDEEILPTVKPDADNVAKIICDALNTRNGFTGAWRDDSQVCELRFKKFYGKIPRVEVLISCLK
jgi:Holliday junction resolvase RusA-like endonuclease